MEYVNNFDQAVTEGDVNALINFKRTHSKEEISTMANRRILGKTALLTSCLEGNFEVVKFLLDNCNVNVEETCERVGLPRDIYDEEMTSLHLAVLHGHLNIVNVLLSHDAQVNTATKTNNTTPLHIACQKKNIDIVKCLLDHGANIDDTNWCGITSLMIACKKANFDLVNLLLSANADVHKKSLRNGNTALHKCCQAQYDNLNIIIDNEDIFMALIDHGASIYAENIYGTTPPLQAALKGNTKLVARLCKSANLLTRKQIIEVKEVFGAHRLVASSGDDMKTALRFWLQALSERNSDPQILKEQRDTSIFSFGQQEEFQDEATLRAIYRNGQTMMFQAFLVLERVLGLGHPFTTHCVLCGPMTMEYCLYALEMQQRYLQPLDPHIRKTLSLAMIVVFNANTDGLMLHERILIILSKLVDHLSMGKCYLEDPANSSNSHILLRELTDLLGEVLQLGSSLARMIDGMDEFVNKFHDVLRKLLSLNLRVASGRHLLHLTICQMEAVMYNRRVPSMELPCLPVIKELLKVGANPNVRDEDGNTPLHLAAMVRSEKKSMKHIKALIASGARTCASNHNGETFLDLLPPGEADVFRVALCSGEKVELACLASRVIKKNKIPFDMLSEKVVDYVLRH